MHGPQSGSPLPPATPTQPQGPPVPVLRVIYKQLPNGARVVMGVEIAGQLFGGILAVNTGFDVTAPTTEHKALARVALTVHWPFDWVDADKLQADLVVATKMPPEPPHPRIVR